MNGATPAHGGGRFRGDGIGDGRAISSGTRTSFVSNPLRRKPWLNQSIQRFQGEGEGEGVADQAASPVTDQAAERRLQLLWRRGFLIGSRSPSGIEFELHRINNLRIGRSP